MYSVVNRTELDRIKKEVVMKDKTQLLAEIALERDQKASKMAVAITRKQRMQRQDRERAATAPLEVKMRNYDEN